MPLPLADPLPCRNGGVTLKETDRRDHSVLDLNRDIARVEVGVPHVGITLRLQRIGGRMP